MAGGFSFSGRGPVFRKREQALRDSPYGPKKPGREDDVTNAYLNRKATQHNPEQAPAAKSDLGAKMCGENFIRTFSVEDGDDCPP